MNRMLMLIITIQWMNLNVMRNVNINKSDSMRVNRSVKNNDVNYNDLMDKLYML